MNPCPFGICDGSGWIYKPDRRHFVECDCFAPRVAEAAIDRAEIRKSYRHATFETFEVQYPDHRTALEASKVFAFNWPETKRVGQCLPLLSSADRMGKSHLASAICHHLIKTYWTRSAEDQDICLFVNVNEWFGDWAKFYTRWPIREGSSRIDYRDDPDWENERLRLSRRDDRMLRTELLVLDDFSRFEQTEGRRNQLYRVVEGRTANGMPIVITDNARTWDEIALRLGNFGGPLVNRIRERTLDGEAIVLRPIEEAPAIAKAEIKPETQKVRKKKKHEAA